jgi:indolepyruvate ferredoxin oxidoreductase beta subunit
MSHVRISENTTWSPQIPKGKADVVISLEPIEAIRVLMSYGNPDVQVLINTRPIYPVGVISGELDYPSMAEIQDSIKDLSARAWYADATEEAIKMGNPILGNIIMIGAVSGIGVLPVGREEFREVIGENLLACTLEINLKAFDIGAAKVKK